MKPTTVILAVLFGLLGSGSAVMASQAGPGAREQVQNLSGLSDENDRFETEVRDGFVFITVSRPMTVRIYSILGQLVAQQSVTPGVTRIRLSARGVYIIKAGSITRRITV